MVKTSKSLAHLDIQNKEPTPLNTTASNGAFETIQDCQLGTPK